jgi:hypothetical protein
MPIYIFIGLVIAALLPFMGLKQDQKTRDPDSMLSVVVQKPQRLKTEIRINQYTFRLFANGEESLEILQNGRRVYTDAGTGLHYFVEAELANSPLLRRR